MNLKPGIIYYGIYTLNCDVKACSCGLKAGRDFLHWVSFQCRISQTGLESKRRNNCVTYKPNTRDIFFIPKTSVD